MKVKYIYEYETSATEEEVLEAFSYDANDHVQDVKLSLKSHSLKSRLELEKETVIVKSKEYIYSPISGPTMVKGY